MDVINDLLFFFQAFGRTMQIVGVLSALIIPSGALGFWLGKRYQRQREPAVVREARQTEREALLETNFYKEQNQRALRYLNSADQMDEKAESFKRLANVNRNVAKEVFGKQPNLVLKLVEDTNGEE